MRTSCLRSRLSPSQRERTEVRNCSGHIFQWPTKSPEEHYRVLAGPDGSRIESQQFLSWPRIVLVSGRISRGADNRGPNHPIQWQVSESDNRNPECTNRSDAGAGICNRRGFDFEDDAREYVRNPSRSCGDNVPDSLGHGLTIAFFCEKGIAPPHLNPLPASGERRIKRTDYRRNYYRDGLMTKWNTTTLTRADKQ